LNGTIQCTSGYGSGIETEPGDGNFIAEVENLTIFDENITAACGPYDSRIGIGTGSSSIPSLPIWFGNIRAIRKAPVQGLGPARELII
jgi:hypothetical protein